MKGSNEGFPRPTTGDLVAGLSVALLVVPQSLAYAELAGMPLITGLFASAIPLIVRAPFSSSPYLQTGPVALTSLLTLSALQSAGFQSDNPDYAKLGAILALLVGGFRLLLGLARMGWTVYLISGPVMQGFTSAAAVLVISSQIPKVLGTSTVVPGGRVFAKAAWSLVNFSQWQGTAILFGILTVTLMVAGRRIHRLFPGVAIAVGVGVALSLLSNNPGVLAGDPNGIPQGLPQLSFDLPWEQTGALVVGGAVIALVGFVEPASIARMFASEEGTRWDSSKELISTGVANIASAASGAFPVGGSFSRSSINRMAGAKTVWSGGITGVVVLAFLPFASILDPLPMAVLGAIIIGAVYPLVNPRAVLRQLRRSWVDALLTGGTFAATLALSPRIQWAVLIGVGLSAVVHFARPLLLQVQDPRTIERSRPAGSGTHSRGERSSLTRIRPVGLVWLGSYKSFDSQLRSIAAARPDDHLEVNFGRDSAIEPSIEDSIAALSEELKSSGQTITVTFSD